MGEDAGLQGKRGRVRMQGCRSCGYRLGCRDAESAGVEEGTGKWAAPLLAQVASPGWPGTDKSAWLGWGPLNSVFLHGKLSCFQALEVDEAGASSELKALPKNFEYSACEITRVFPSKLS